MFIEHDYSAEPFRGIELKCRLGLPHSIFISTTKDHIWRDTASLVHRSITDQCAQLWGKENNMAVSRIVGTSTAQFARSNPVAFVLFKRNETEQIVKEMQSTMPSRCILECFLKNKLICSCRAELILAEKRVSVSIPRDAGEVGDESAEILVSYSVMVVSWWEC